MAKGKKGRAGKAARYKAIANGGGSTDRHMSRDIASHFQPNMAATQNFSLADEIRHTAHNHGSSLPLGSLRGRPVAFVSAGVVEPLKELDHGLIAGDHGREPEMTAAGVESANEQARPSLFTSNSMGSYGGNAHQRHTGLDSAVDELPQGKADATFFIDLAGDKDLTQHPHEPVSIPFPQVRPPSSNGSSSGADFVVFRGRRSQQEREKQRSPITTDEIAIQVQTVEQSLQHISLASESMPQRNTTPPIPAWQLRGHNDDDDLVADYIANMDNGNNDDDNDDDEADDVQDYQSRFQTSFGNRDLGGADGDFVIAEELQNDASSSDDDGDDDAGDGDDDDDDDLYEDGGQGPSDADDGSEIPEVEDVALAAAGLTNQKHDEALARLLAKQEELGIHEDELVITSEEMARYKNRFTATSNSSITKYHQAIEAPWKSVKNGAHKLNPSASAIADVFDDMDLAMDWGRHNPPRKPKAKYGQATFGLSDSEMEAHLQATFKKDRIRKKERKIEREELRAAGLLGKHGNPEDLRVKYPTGITIDQIKVEMRSFLQGDDETMTFPPMDSNARKSIHEICLRLNLKSKSTGNGDQRRPILYRTKRTGTYRENVFEAAFARPGRRYFHRMDVNKTPGGGRGGAGKANGRGVNSAAFTYKDGEVVGGGAPELAANNKGRALMEKMGWSAGMALGANDNQGILQPVAHVVKRTKAGLG
ncbi:unnamed protein product [Discula destructiva]